jgi:hypothetical protein
LIIENRRAQGELEVKPDKSAALPKAATRFVDSSGGNFELLLIGAAQHFDCD